MSGETEVYGDLLFLINGGMDCLCFLLSARLLRIRLSRVRLAIGSALGGIYAVLALLIRVGQATALVIDLSVCLLLCLVVFAPQKSEGGRVARWRTIFPATGVYLLVSLLLGGIMTGLYNLLNRTGLSQQLSAAGADGPTAWLFTVLALVGGALTLWGGRLFHHRGSVRECTVTVELSGRRVSVEGLVDSGNLLTDPVGGRPVIPVDSEQVRSLFSPALLAAIGQGEAHLEALTHTPEARRVRLIPTVTATGQRLLVGIRPDRLTVTVHTPRGKRVTEVDALIAPTALSSANGTAEEGAQALVPAELI